MSSRQAAVAILIGLAAGQVWGADLLLRGRVVDENGAPVREARVEAAGIWEGETDPTGSFTISLPKPGNLSLSIEREGYYALKNQIIHLDATQAITFVINSVHEVFQSENVNAQASPVDVGETQTEEHLSGTEVNDIPFTNSHSLQNALGLFPGTVQDTAGGLHLNGGDQNQIQYLFNGFNITDPITGQFQTLIPVEGIRSLDLSSGQTSAEFGKGSAGVLQVNTESGTDRFHYTATDFVPGIDIKQGVRLGNWYPRLGVSGPIRRGRAWFSELFQSEYTQALINGLPNGQNTRSGWAGSDIVHGQVNLSSSNILFADFLVNIDNQGRAGLGVLNPVETTSQVDSRQYLGSIKDQEYFGRGALVAIGYAHSYFSISNKPLGDGLYILTPEGTSGNNYVHSQQSATRDEVLLQAFLPKIEWLGTQQVQVGTDSDWLHYNADFRRTGYEVLGLNGQLLSETLFSNPAQFHTTDAELSAYIVDTWRIAARLQLSLGLRGDHDQAIGATGWSPRAALSWSPFESGKTKVSGGYAITHDAVTLQMLGLPLDQTPITTIYGADGTPTGPPVVSRFEILRGDLALPRAGNWTLSADQQLSTRLFVGVKLLRRRGSNGFAFVNTLEPNAPPSLLPGPNSQGNALYQLNNLRRDDYDSVQFSVRQTLSGQYGWSAAYLWSRSVSNAVIDPNSPVPVQDLANLVPTTWDVPQRIVARGYGPLPWKNWAISAFLDWRTGLPFSVRDQTGLIYGGVDSYRFPDNFDLNIAIERIFTLRGHRFALRGGMDNVTNQANASAVNNVLGTPNYLQLLGKEGRHFVVRIRFFQKSGK